MGSRDSNHLVMSRPNHLPTVCLCFQLGKKSPTLYVDSLSLAKAWTVRSTGPISWTWRPRLRPAEDLSRQRSMKEREGLPRNHRSTRMMSLHMTQQKLPNAYMLPLGGPERSATVTMMEAFTRSPLIWSDSARSGHVATEGHDPQTSDTI